MHIRIDDAMIPNGARVTRPEGRLGINRKREGTAGGTPNTDPRDCALVVPLCDFPGPWPRGIQIQRRSMMHITEFGIVHEDH